MLTTEPTWIIDPIDGTMNFVHSFPYTCISVGLWVNKQAEIGIVYNPVLDQMFTATKGQGAYLNGERIHTSGQTGKFSKSTVALWSALFIAYVVYFFLCIRILIVVCNNPLHVSSILQS